MSLNPQSPVPLYQQLVDRIRSAIEAGDYAVAARIPSEHELAQRYSIGRPTVRQATDLLVRQGLLERRRGSGTYVLPPSQSIDLFSLAGTSAALQKSDLQTELKLVSGPVSEPTDKLSAGVKPGQLVDAIKIERQATADGVPVLYETLWFDAQLFAGLEKHVFGEQTHDQQSHDSQSHDPQFVGQQSGAQQSLSKLVRDVFFLEPSSADQTFSVALSDSAQSRKLEVRSGTPVLCVYRDLHFGEHRNALHAQILCRTDKFQFSQTLYPANTGAAELHSSVTNSASSSVLETAN